MRDIILAATAFGVVYLIWKERNERKCSCAKERIKEVKPSEKLTEDMKVYALQQNKQEVIPDRLYKQYETDAGATVSKNRMRYKFKRKLRDDIFNANEI